jgi:hypothetical protein
MAEPRHDQRPEKRSSGLLQTRAKPVRHTLHLAVDSDRVGRVNVVFFPQITLPRPGRSRPGRGVAEALFASP